MDDNTPGLEVGFAIDTGSSYEALVQLSQMMDSTEAKILQEAASIERATGSMVNTAAATASIRTFGAAATKEYQSVARERLQAERAGERLVRSLDREAAALGKTRSEMRAAKVETAALAAEKAGLTELSTRLRAKEAQLAGDEAMAARAARYAAEDAAAARQRAADEAAAAAAREAQAIRDAANAYRLFEAVARQKSATYREQQALAAAAAAKTEAETTARLAREHSELANRLRESHAAMEADAVAAERLRLSTDPLYAATRRLNEEIAESTRLYRNGATAPAEYARQQDVLANRLREVKRQHDLFNAGMGTAGANGQVAGHHMQNLAFQLQDLSVQMAAAAGSSDPLKMGLMALFQQGLQIQGVMSQAGMDIRGLGNAIAGMGRNAVASARAHPALLALGGAVTAAAAGIGFLNDEAKDSAAMQAYVKSLGLTAAEIRSLDNVTVTYGDTAKAVFQIVGRSIWEQIGPSVSSVWAVMKDWTSWIFGGVKSAINFMIGGFVGAYNVITKTWQQFPAALGDMFYSGVNLAINATNELIQRSIEGLNSFAAQANKILPEAMQIPTLSAPRIAAVANDYAGAGKKFGEVARAEMEKAMDVDYLGNFADAINNQAQKNARARLRQQALEKGYLDPEKDSGSGNERGERLAREAAAIEAQIRNLYALAEAYKISGAAALIAEARVKAESEAIKKRGDIEAMVDRQVRLAIAQRVTDAAKATAALRDQATIQEQLNERVAAGNLTAERAAELVKERIADLPLLAAAQAAQQRGLAEEAMKATAALADQQAERERLRQAEEGAEFNRDMSEGANRLAELQEELRLIGATNIERVRGLAIIRAAQEAEAKYNDPARRDEYIAQQLEIAEATETVAVAQRELNDALSFTADKWDIVAQSVQNAAQGIAEAFGRGGQAIGDMAAIYADFRAQEARAAAIRDENLRNATSDAARQREFAKYQLATSTAQVGLYGDMADAAKGFFKEKSTGYRAIMAVEKVYRAFELAMSLRAMVQDVMETTSSVANSAARATANGAEGVAAQAKLPFPLNIAAMAATAAALVAAGIAILGSGGGGKNNLPESNTGTGTVLGDGSAQSDSIKNAINALKDVDTLMLNYSRQMAASLQSIESQIGGFASLLVRNADSLNASGGLSEGFNANTIGKVLGSIPLVGGLLKGLFGTKTTVVGSGLFGGAQSLESVLGAGFDASYYSDVQKKKKFLGITTSTKYSTSYTGADPLLESQFTLILKSFNDAIVAAAGPLGASTSEIQRRLNGFIVNIGKIDLQGLTGEQIEEKLNAVFGAAADNMATAAFPLISQFQKVGEGAFETLVRVASTIEAVGASLDLLGQSAQGMSIAVKLGLADQFESVSELTSAVDSYFTSFYTKEEQAAARTAQMATVFQSLGLAMPTTLAGFRALVEAQNLNTTAGQATYATLLKLAPAFAELQSALEGAKSAADIASERADLQRQLLELQGDTAALRALQLAKLDESNRALQMEIWALQDAQAAAKAADELRKAWSSVGDSIMDEVRRIRGMTDATGATGFAALQGQFNAATAAARAGDMDAAKSLPTLSKALLDAAADAATSRQELDRVRALIAASLEATKSVVDGFAGSPAAVNAALLNSAASSQPGASAINDNSAAVTTGIDELRAETVQLRTELTAALATIAGNTGKVAKKLDDVTADSGGDAVSVRSAA